MQETQVRQTVSVVFLEDDAYSQLKAGDLRQQGSLRGTAAQGGDSSVRYRAVNWVRNSIYRPLLRLSKQVLGGVFFLRDPVSIAEHRDVVTKYTRLQPAQTIDFGEPASDPFLRSCQYIVDGKLSRGPIFVCEVADAKFYPRIGLVFDRRWRPILESIFDLSRFHMFRRMLRPRKVIRYEGTVSSVQHIFYENHWHWTVDSLPQVLSLIQYMKGEPLKLLMPDSLPGGLRRQLEILMPANFEVEYVPTEDWVECDRFVLPSYISSRTNGFLPAEYYEFMRNQVFEGLNVSKPAVCSGRYYISRSRAAHRRVLNEAEVLGVLEPLGFECIWMEDLSFTEQVRLLRGAECLVSSHGAGLSCMLYGDDLKVCVLYPETKPAGYFYTLARGLGHEHFQTNAAVLEDDDFEVDLRELRRVLTEEMQLTGSQARRNLRRVQSVPR